MSHDFLAEETWKTTVDRKNRQWPGKPVGRGQRGDKETEEKEEVEEMDEWARETRNEVKIDSAGETSGSVLCWFKQRTGCLVLYNHGEQSVITPPPVPISSRSFFSVRLLLLSFLAISSSSGFAVRLIVFSFSFVFLLSLISHCSLRLPLCPSSLVVPTRWTSSTFLLSSPVHHDGPDATVTRITRISLRPQIINAFLCLVTS